MIHRVTIPTIGTALAWFVVTSLASAQTSGADKASAEALFNEGVSLVAAGNYDNGCHKFEASQSLDPTLGTELRLADCYERSKRTASAWATFKHAQGLAHVQGQAEREELARQRVESLAPQLTYLILTFDGPPPASLVVTRNGAAVPLASLGVAIPVDPGPQQFTASAPGHQPWQKSLELAPTPGNYSLRIPALAERSEPAVAPPPNTETQANASTSTQQTAGIVTGVVGLVSILTGSSFGIYAKNRGDRSKLNEFCPTDGHNGCTAQGLALRDRARTFGTASTITFVAGAALLTTGIVLYGTSPAHRERPARAGLELRAAGTPYAFLASLGGAW